MACHQGRGASYASLLAAVASLLVVCVESAPWIRGTTEVTVPIGGKWLWLSGSGFDNGMTLALATTAGAIAQPSAVTVVSATLALVTIAAVPASLDGATVYGVAYNPDGSHSAKTLLATVSDGKTCSRVVA